MTSKSANEKAKKPAKNSELKPGDLDKVTGGFKPVTGPTTTKPKGVIGDPCEGGQ